MSLPSVSIKNPIFAWMMMWALMLFGAFAATKMGVGFLPDVDFPQLSVTVELSGAAPELVEKDITDIVEGALVTVEGVSKMTSSSRFGSSSVNLEFEIGKNMDVALQEVQSALQQVQGNFPVGTEFPIIKKSNPEDRPIMYIGLSGDVSRRELMRYATFEMKDQFTTLEGVGDIQLGGYLKPIIKISINPLKLKEYDLTFQDIVASIRQEHLEVPVGRLFQEKNEISIRIFGEAKNIKDLEEIPITRRAGQTIFTKLLLKDLAIVKQDLEEARRLARSNGKAAVGIGIIKKPGANSVEIARVVKEKLAQIKLPKGYFAQINFDGTEPIKHSILELLFTMILSIGLTAIICWLFLGSFSATFNILLAIPTSLLGTFIIIHMLGYTLNLFTMLALILAIGIVVDDAIMVLENVFRNIEQGKSPAVAALKGTEEIQFAALAATLAIIAIFIPVAYVSGILGAYLTHFAVTLSIAVGWSLFEALSFTPMRLSQMKKIPAYSGIPARFNKMLSRVADYYSTLVKKVIERPLATVSVLLVFFAGTLYLAKLLPKEMIPREDSRRLMIRTELPVGTNIEENSKRLVAVEKIIEEEKEIEKSYVVIGGFGSSQVNTAFIFASLKERAFRSPSTLQVEERMRERFQNEIAKDLKVRIQDGGQSALGGGRRGYPIEINVYGEEWSKIIESAKQLRSEMEKNPAFRDVDSDYNAGNPEIHVIPNREKSRLYGISVDVVGETLSYVFNGREIAQFDDEGRRVDILVKGDERFAPNNKKDFSKIFLRNNRAQLVALSDLVEVKETNGPVTVSRENRQRKIAVYANTGKNTNLGEALKIAEGLSKTTMLAGTRAERAGASADLGKTFKELTIALLLGILVAYMILASQFNSLRDPIIILSVLPFSVSGALIALYAFGSTLNLYSMIGLLLLMGIVKKNSILIVEFMHHLRAEGKSLKESIIEACRVRFRPVVMTSFTTIAAALPPALKIGSNTQASADMSLGIIGGILVSTLITFFVVPAFIVILSTKDKHNKL